MRDIKETKNELAKCLDNKTKILKAINTIANDDPNVLEAFLDCLTHLNTSKRKRSLTWKKKKILLLGIEKSSAKKINAFRKYYQSLIHQGFDVDDILSIVTQVSGDITLSLIATHGALLKEKYGFDTSDILSIANHPSAYDVFMRIILDDIKYSQIQAAGYDTPKKVAMLAGRAGAFYFITLFLRYQNLLQLCHPEKIFIIALPISHACKKTKEYVLTDYFGPQDFAEISSKYGDTASGQLTRCFLEKVMEAAKFLKKHPEKAALYDYDAVIEQAKEAIGHKLKKSRTPRVIKKEMHRSLSDAQVLASLTVAADETATAVVKTPVVGVSDEDLFSAHELEKLRRLTASASSTVKLSEARDTVFRREPATKRKSDAPPKHRAVKFRYK